ncbi:MAG: hypothetical protein H6619_04645 [Deltaproteobacteria bacterium]|nr:hypothetical protein [Deltaproteobacteria bacterium]
MFWHVLWLFFIGQLLIGVPLTIFPMIAKAIDPKTSDLVLLLPGATVFSAIAALGLPVMALSGKIEMHASEHHGIPVICGMLLSFILLVAGLFFWARDVRSEPV